MELPTLYRITAKKQTYQWTIKVVGDDKENPDESDETHMITVYGMVGGKMVTQKRKVVPKGKKTPWEQAVFNAKKKWEDRKKKDGYTEDIREERPFFTPMLAQTLKQKVDKKTKKTALNIKFPCHAQPKLDGHRCMAKYEGKEEPVQLLSRKNIEYKGFATLKDQLFTYIYAQLPASGFGSGEFYVDGELMVQGVPFEELSGQIKRAAYHADVDLPHIEFHIFDCFDAKAMDTSFEDRSDFLRDIIPDEHKNIKFVQTVVVANEEELLDHFAEFIADGHEGIMVRETSSPYKPGKRPACLKKYKEMQDSEFEIIGFNEAKGEDRGTVIWVCKTDSGQEFTCRPKGTRELRREWFENGGDYVGKQLTVIYQELSEIGVPRFPVGKCVRD